MYVIHQKYIDFNGNERNDDFYFNLTKAEIVELSCSEEVDISKPLDEYDNTKESIKLFKTLLIMAYGVRTEDGKFIKNQKLRDDFIQSAAYSEIFMNIVTNTDKASAFFEGVLPKLDNNSPIPPQLPNKKIN